MEALTIIVILIAVVFVIMLFSVCAAVVVGGMSDDESRWLKLKEEMILRYPNATYSAQLEFLRRDKYLAIREATLKHEDISDLTEDYQMILDEQERLTEGDRQLGGEFQPFVSNQNTERI